MEIQNYKKLKTLIGFAIKSNRLKYGIDNITKKADIVIVSMGLASSAMQKLQKQCEQNQIKFKKLLIDDFAAIIKEGVKVISIEKCELSNAIYQLMEEI